MQEEVYADDVFHIIATEAPAGLRLIGQADVAHRQVLERELRRVARGHGDFHLDLNALEFIDVGSVRLLMDTAAVLSLDGRQLVISGPRPPVLRSLRICGCDAADNVRVIDGEIGGEPEHTGEALANSEVPEPP